MLTPPLFLILGSTLVGSSEEPLARRLSRELSAMPRLAGTAGSLRAAHLVAAELEEWGWEVELDERVVLLSLPRRVAFEATVGIGGERSSVGWSATFDPDASDPGDVPLFHAWSASGVARGRVVDAGRGLRADFEELVAEGVRLEGTIALARYGGSYRGVKPELAQEYGCIGVLLYSTPRSDGAERGEVWPEGPWKPGTEAERGSISSLARNPGDPSTPGWPSPVPGAPGERLEPEAIDAFLPGILSTPIGADHATAILKTLAAGEEVWVRLELDVPRELRTITNVIARLPGTGDDFVIAGNHRDSWVRGAHDAGSGTVSLMLAAHQLAERVRSGWTPANGIVLGFWDAEESGLIGSTEWAEAHAAELREHAIAYFNADAVVSGTKVGASGTPGLYAIVRAALEGIPAPEDEPFTPSNMWERFDPAIEESFLGGLPGSGSDYTVFLHHLGIPIVDISLRGNSGGQYHTRFDDFEFMERYLDPDWTGHEIAGWILAHWLEAMSEGGLAAFSDAEAARAMAVVAERIDQDEEVWIEAERVQRLRSAFLSLARAIEANPEAQAPRFYQSLQRPGGLRERSWYRNALWAPGLETGYAAESFPSLRAAAREGDEALERELELILGLIGELERDWTPDDRSDATTGNETR